MSDPKRTISAITQIGQLALHVAETFEAEALRLASMGPIDEKRTFARVDLFMRLAVAYQQLAHTCDVDCILAQRQGADLALKDIPQ